MAEKTRPDRACVLPLSSSNRTCLPIPALLLADRAGPDPACVLPLRISSAAPLPIQPSIRLKLVRRDGNDPSSRGSQPRVLPLHHRWDLIGGPGGSRTRVSFSLSRASSTCLDALRCGQAARRPASPARYPPSYDRTARRIDAVRNLRVDYALPATRSSCRFDD